MYADAGENRTTNASTTRIASGTAGLMVIAVGLIRYLEDEEKGRKKNEKLQEDVKTRKSQAE
jgi:hypothetical protein